MDSDDQDTQLEIDVVERDTCARCRLAFDDCICEDGPTYDPDVDDPYNRPDTDG